MQKLNARKATLQKTSSIPDKEKPKWMKYLVPELMSSEDNEDDGSFVLHQIPWRSQKANDFITSIDTKYDTKRSKKSKVMTAERIPGTYSDRPKPAEGTLPLWTIKD